MKLFEEFENDLRDVNSLKSLIKVMFANGVLNVDINDLVISVSEYGLVESVPQELWVAENVDKYDATIVVRQNGIEIMCYVVNKDAFTKRTGFKFPEVKQ